MYGPRRRFRYKRHRRMREMQSAIWLIGLGILFLTRWWWPGILIVIGVSMVVGALVREDHSRDERDTLPPLDPLPPIPEPEPLEGPSAFTSASPTPVNQPLPSACPNCGGGKFERLSPDRAECWHCGAQITL
jgi:hypothetical protein